MPKIKTKAGELELIPGEEDVVEQVTLPRPAEATRGEKMAQIIGAGLASLGAGFMGQNAAVAGMSVLRPMMAKEAEGRQVDRQATLMNLNLRRRAKERGEERAERVGERIAGRQERRALSTIAERQRRKAEERQVRRQREAGYQEIRGALIGLTGDVGAASPFSPTYDPQSMDGMQAELGKIQKAREDKRARAMENDETRKELMREDPFVRDQIDAIVVPTEGQNVYGAADAILNEANQAIMQGDTQAARAALERLATLTQEVNIKLGRLGDRGSGRFDNDLADIRTRFAKRMAAATRMVRTIGEIEVQQQTGAQGGVPRETQAPDAPRGRLVAPRGTGFY